MGQPISVVTRRTPHPGTVRLEINRSLTGMEHLRYTSRAQATGERPPDELARRLFDRGGVEAVHVYSNVITVNLARGATDEGLTDLVEQLFIHYRPGVTPTPVEEPGEEGAEEPQEA